MLCCKLYKPRMQAQAGCGRTTSCRLGRSLPHWPLCQFQGRAVNGVRDFSGLPQRRQRNRAVLCQCTTELTVMLCYAGRHLPCRPGLLCLLRSWCPIQCAQQQGIPLQALLEAALEPTPGLTAGAAVNSGVFLLGIRVLLAGDKQASSAEDGAACYQCLCSYGACTSCVFIKPSSVDVVGEEDLQPALSCCSQ